MTKKNRLKIIFLIVVIFLVLSVSCFFVWTCFYYKADSVALELYENLENSKKLEIIDNAIVMNPDLPNNIGIIFYPGAKVETIAYIPLFEELRQRGFTCVLLDMPFHLAFFAPDAANNVYEMLPSIDNWYVTGHSLGGVMASSYASKNPEKIEGLVVMGAYVYGDYPQKNALTIYGTFNSNLEKSIDYTDNIVILDGGNHAQFGNYGRQKGDPDATITPKEQQRQTIDAMLDFILQD